MFPHIVYSPKAPQYTKTKSVWPAVGLRIKTTWRLSCLLPSIPTTASIYLLIIPLIWESFSTCCCRSLRSLSSSRFWYCRRILLVCCSCVSSLRSYSSSFLWDITRRSFRELISSSYSRTWGGDTNEARWIRNARGLRASACHGNHILLTDLFTAWWFIHAFIPESIFVLVVWFHWFDSLLSLMSLWCRYISNM